MMKISINDRVFSCHPVYDLYAGSEDGKVINIIKRYPAKGIRIIEVICFVVLGNMLNQVIKHI